MIRSISKEDRKMIRELLFSLGVKAEQLRLHLYYKYPQAEIHEAVETELNELDILLSTLAGGLDLLAAKHGPLNEEPKNVQRTARERFARDNRRTNATSQIGR